jgi:nitrate reductase beta subunit
MASLKAGGRFRMLAKIFANPDLPQIDDYYEPFDFDYQHLHRRRIGQHQPTARPRSLISWRAHAEDRLGAELGRNPRHRVRQAQQGQKLRPCSATSTAPLRRPS